MTNEHSPPGDADSSSDVQGKLQDMGSTLAGYQRMDEGAGSEADSWPMTRLMWDRRVMLSALLCGLLAFVTIAVAQLLPLLLVSSYEHGGFSMDSSQISIVVSVLGVVVMVDQPAFRGSTNGIAQSMTVLVRLLGPLVFGNLFAWSSDNGLPWPLSYHLSFNMVGLLSLLAAFLCTRLPDSINCKREEDSLPSQHIQDGDQGFYEDGAEDYYAQQALH
ncbi:uncharacterized protein LOC118423731 isoform X2 [Branchiostoma floridae]|uniref:Uncharacterized protein LOC118423731 isoform X2 n=1 Tax=Branchiostoma floridae TaxID=7739 RepID=A0A9J7N376_BRAFL|nr:uncharacterized protein LOC118423731 isoform X2 [Branchiostoma floridae]